MRTGSDAGRASPTYRLADPRAVAPALDIDAFRSGAEGAFEAIGAAPVALARVRCWASRPDAWRPGSLDEIDPRDAPIQRPLGMPAQGDGFLDAVAHPALSIVRLDGATCCPGGIVLRDDMVFVDSFSAPWEVSQHRHMTQADGRWHLDGVDPHAVANAATIDEPALYLDHQHVDWFGHVIADLLGPAWAYEYLKAYLGVDHLLVVCSEPTFAFVRTLLSLLGAAERDMRFIRQPVRCRELLLASKGFQLQHYVSPPSFRLWQGMGNRVAPLRSPVERLYVSRRANPTRRLVEEDAIEAIFAANGFFILHPEALDVRDQIRLFAGATLIAGCSGSNLFTLAFAARVRAVMLLVSPLLVHYSEQFFLSRHPDAVLDVIIGHTEDAERAARPGDVHAPWHLAPPRVAQRVAAWLSGQASISAPARP